MKTITYTDPRLQELHDNVVRELTAVKDLRNPQAAFGVGFNGMVELCAANNINFDMMMLMLNNEIKVLVNQAKEKGYYGG